MTIQQMRDYISKHPRYKNSVKWKQKCQWMPEHQVVAVYNKFKQLDYKKIEKEIKQLNKDNTKYHQVDMFEYMEGNDGK